MGSITPTPTAEKRAAFTLSVLQKAAPIAEKLGSITPTPTADKRAAFTLALVSKAGPTVVKWVA